MKIHVSETTFEHIETYNYICEERGTIDMKVSYKGEELVGEASIIPLCYLLITTFQLQHHVNNMLSFISTIKGG